MCSLEILDKSVCIGKGQMRTCVQFSEFPKLYKSFVDNIPEGSTLRVEKYGARIVNQTVNKDSEIYDFVRCVCNWGGGQRVFGNLPRHNSGKDAAQKNIAHAVRKSVDYLRKSEMKKSIEVLHNVKGLGMSYASKILRMLSPDKAVVFDSWLEKATKKPDTDFRYSSYTNWCNECVELTKILKQKKIKNNVRHGGWKAADVEAVIFNEVRRKNRK